MSNNKLTAVEWLMENLHTAKDPFTQAKEMEKQQIVNAVDGFPLDKRHLSGEQYYNEEYNK